MSQPSVRSAVATVTVTVFSAAGLMAVAAVPTGTTSTRPEARLAIAVGARTSLALLTLIATVADPPELADFPLVRRSVVNYGVPSFSGRSSRDFDRDTLAKEIRTILATYEPRLKDGATKVTVMLGDKNVGLKIDIDAVLIMTPTPERMRFRTVVNLDNGMARTEIADG